MSFLQIALQLEPRFGKKTLEAPSQVEVYSTTKEEVVSSEQWGDRIMDIAQSFNGKSPEKVLQEQVVLRF